MNYSKEGGHIRVRGNKRLHVALRCCWKMKVLLTCAKALKNKGCWSTMNQVVMIEATKAQFFK